jgi:mannose/fructose/N-acetylgalactosamine-specific phosphotransferase system component IIC
MEKLSGIFKKFNGIIAIVVFALLGVFALGMATPAAPCISYTGTDSATIAAFYFQIQPYNDDILYFALAGLFLAFFYNVLRNQLRPIYYISNFIWTILYFFLALASAIFTFIGVSFYQSKYVTLPFDAINQNFIDHGIKTRINPNTPVFALGYVVAALVLLSAIAVGFVGVYQFVKQHQAHQQKAAMPNEGGAQ